MPTQFKRGLNTRAVTPLPPFFIPSGARSCLTGSTLLISTPVLLPSCYQITKYVHLHLYS